MSLPDGWSTFPSNEGTVVAKKFFGDHWKELKTLPEQLEAAVAQVEYEFASRVLGDQAQAVAAADDLSAQADAIKAAVDDAEKPEIVEGKDAPNADEFAHQEMSPLAETAPEPVTVDQDAPANPPVTVPSDAEVHVDADAVRADLVAAEAAKPVEDETPEAPAEADNAPA